MMNTMGVGRDRTVREIVDMVMDKIPDHVKPEFSNVLVNLMYTAPEIEGNWFNEQFLLVVNEVIPPRPTELWQFEAIAALARITVEEARERYGIRVIGN